MKKILALILGLLIAIPAIAAETQKITLNKIIIQLHTEQWLTSKSALVNVSINAAVADQGIENVRSNVMQKLQQIGPKGEWHVLSFNRQQDPSGLESIQMLAQARLDQADLNGLRDKAKTISKAGETFKIESIEFTPSEQEIRAANIAMRADIYQQAKAEIDAINAAYPNQTYYLHKIDFTAQTPIPLQKNRMYAAEIAATSAPSIDVGNKAEMTATVIIASTPEGAVSKQ